MKRYLINSRVLVNIMKLSSPRSKAIVPSGDRCLKLGVLRCLRQIIALKDEFYNRHIVQHSLFTPVFEAFRANPVGDNLISSAIVGTYMFGIVCWFNFNSLFNLFFFYRNMRIYLHRECEIAHGTHCDETYAPKRYADFAYGR